MDGLGRAIGSGTTFELTIEPAVTRRATRPGPDGPEEYDEVVTPAVTETIVVSPLTLDDLGMIDQQILSERPPPEEAMNRLLKATSDPLAKEMIVTASLKAVQREKNVTSAEMADWVSTTRGTVYSFWLVLRKENPKYQTIEAVRGLMERIDPNERRELARRRDIASGTDAMGNPTGPTAKPAADRAADVKGSRRSPFLGGGSSSKFAKQ